MVKQFQVGKRYRYGSGIWEYLVLFVASNGDAFCTCFTDLSDVKEESVILRKRDTDLMSIVPPKPRTGKAFIVTNAVGDQFFCRKKPSIHQTSTLMEIEWKEIIPDDQNSEG